MSTSQSRKPRGIPTGGQFSSMGRSESDVELDGEPVDEFVPSYSSWRHGGWYVDNVRYPSGAVGCVSRNYEDRKWRIVCDPRPFEDAPTFKSRDDAARAELELTERHAAAPCTCPPPPADVDERLHHLHQSNDCARHGRSSTAWKAVEEFEAQEAATHENSGANPAEAAPQTCTVTNSDGRSFTARLVRIGESVETKTKAIVEIYDDTYAGDPRFGPHGQRASSYYVDTFNEVNGGLDLDGGVPVWQIGPDEVRAIQGWLNEVGADGQRSEDDPFTTDQAER